MEQLLGGRFFIRVIKRYAKSFWKLNGRLSHAPWKSISSMFGTASLGFGFTRICVALHDGKILKCSQICSLYCVIIGISHSLVYHSLSIQGLTNSLYRSNIYV
jgi:hypothetical protein